MHINGNDLTKGNDKFAKVVFRNPKFSPDASKIVVSRKNTFGATIYIMDQDGQNLKEIGDGYLPCFTPDGQRIAANEKLGQIFTCDLNGEDKRILVPKNPNDHFLDTIRNINFTPDGNGIYFIQYYFSTRKRDLNVRIHLLMMIY